MVRERELKNGYPTNLYLERELVDACLQRGFNISLICRRALAQALSMPLEEYKRIVKKDKWELAAETLKTAIPSRRYAEILSEIIQKTNFSRKKVVEWLSLQKGQDIINIENGMISYNSPHEIEVKNKDGKAEKQVE